MKSRVNPFRIAINQEAFIGSYSNYKLKYNHHNYSSEAGNKSKAILNNCPIKKLLQAKIIVKLHK